MNKGIIVNQEWKNDHFNVITDNEALAEEIELQNGDKVILATIYCSNGNPSLRLFRMINALSKQVIFLGDFNSKHKKFGCVKPNKSGQTLVNIAKDLKRFYVNQLGSNRHMHEDPVHGTSDILDMAIITPDDHMGNDHFPIQISLDKSPISQAILDLIKEKHRLRWLYNNTQDPNIKFTINRLQKEIRTKINQESTISWEKFCNSISL